MPPGPDRRAALGLIGGAAWLVLSPGPGFAASCALPDDAATLMAAAGEAMNAVRVAQGLAPLARLDAVDRAAQGHACWMGSTGTFSHQGEGGSLPKKRIRAAGYRSTLTAENIAWGQKTGAQVVAEWMTSEGHRKNILLRGVKKYGVGVALMQGRVAWVMDFAA